MTRRRRNSSPRRRDPSRLFPVVGLVAIVGLLFAVYISYTANNGVPGADYREFSVEVPDANRMVKNNQVRIAGVRVGQVVTIEAVAGRDGRPAFSRLDVKLDKDAPDVPVDSTAKVRPASILGATYLDIIPGRNQQDVAEKGTLPLAQSKRNVELTDLLDVFDPKTARAFQQGTSEIGGGLAGRGRDLGRTVTGLARLMPRVAAVADNLADPSTRLGRLIVGFDGAMNRIAAVRPILATGLTDSGTTFEALDRSEDALGQTLDDFPATAATTTAALRRLRPALNGLGQISLDLRPAARVLPGALARTNALFKDTSPWLRVVPSAARPLRTTAMALEDFAKAPSTVKGFGRVGDVFEAVTPLLESLTAAQLHCNAITLFGQGWHNVFGTVGAGDGPPVGSTGFSALGTSPLETIQNEKPLPNLHTNYTPNATADECEAGNEPFSNDKQDLSNPAGLQSKTTAPVLPAAPLVVQRAKDAGLSDTPPGSR